jgi:hypothetical protein
MILQCNDFIVQGQEFDKSCTPGPFCMKKPGSTPAQIPPPPPEQEYPVQPVQLKYQGGTARWHVGEKMWWIYLPKPIVLSGEVVPTPDAKEPGTQASPPPGTTIGPIIDVPVYKKAWFWAVIGGGAAVLGTGGYFIFRKKR